MNVYPFGLQHKGYNNVVNGTAHPYKFGGKEHNEELGLDLYDYGARMYDPAIGRWSVLDNLSEVYYSYSSYIYALNTPIQAIDPDGNIVIFINGQHGGDGAKGYQNGGSNWRGTSDYWRNFDTSKSNWLSQPNKIAFNALAMNQLGDHNAIYRDGSDGGWANTTTRPRIGNTKNNLSASNRRNAGKVQGAKDAARIIEAIKDSNGNVVETIKIITHSMGGAYGKGYVKALKKYIKTLPIEQQREIKITLVADFDPFNGNQLKADENIHTQQHSHLGGLADQQQEGADESFTTKGKHSIFSFVSNISNLQEGTYKWNGTDWECTSCKK
ncbi:RHS repeat-associated core domain-containing protein [Polaribacter glomeratus]|uniref:RHS repeat-associated core domain-containing protein n=1 Tax=Polaribacter glomeratus TaxID=102 RepID=UPI0011BE6B8C|nr:RHS repeat-associated core domain-containing protein [Polaribacter glomeratus]TXD64176.1 hypothetical protein ESX12_15810 [Polaribacter glomeratus]